MSHSLKYFDPDTLAKLQTLSLRTHRVVDGFLAGVHRSPTRGFSVEFAEHREYVPGEDLRNVDWKAFGRTDRLVLKQFEDETNLCCYLVVDTSESMHYQGPTSSWSKFDHVAVTAASLGWLALRRQDAVGLATFDDQVRSVLLPSNHPAQANQIIRQLEQITPQRKTSLGGVLHELAGRFRRRGIVIVFSDLFANLDEIVLGLRHLRHVGHDVIVIHAMDGAEMDFPFRTTTQFRSLEDGDRLLVNPRSVRQAYCRQITRFCRDVEERCTEQQVDYLFMRNDQPVHSTLARFLFRRNRRGS